MWAQDLTPVTTAVWNPRKKKAPAKGMITAVDETGTSVASARETATRTVTANPA